MKTKQLELIILSLAVLLALTYAIVLLAGGSAASMRFMNITLAIGVAIYIGYVFLTQTRNQQRITAQADRIGELEQTVADREKKLKAAEKNLSEAKAEIEDAHTRLSATEKKLKAAEAEISKLSSAAKEKG